MQIEIPSKKRLDYLESLSLVTRLSRSRGFIGIDVVRSAAVKASNSRAQIWAQIWAQIEGTRLESRLVKHFLFSSDVAHEVAFARA